MGEKGGGLGKEDGKGAQGGVLDGLLRILAPSGIGEVVKHGVERRNACIEVERTRHLPPLS